MLARGVPVGVSAYMKYVSTPIPQEMQVGGRLGRTMLARGMRMNVLIRYPCATAIQSEKSNNDWVDNKRQG